MGRNLLKRIFSEFWTYKSTVIVFLVPILLTPLLIVNPNKETRCLYGVAIILIFWVTEVVPFSVTALLPLVLFPTLGIIPAKKVAQNYLQDSLVLFIGGFFIAIAIERANLHKRIALKSLLIVGENPKWILFGLMATTGFLSMWIINTAATTMMMPISEAILIELIKSNRSRDHAPHNADTEMNTVDKENNSCKISKENNEKEKIELVRDKLTPYELSLCKMILLSICYAANIGGIATMTGTQANIIVVGMLETKYGPNVNISYASWMGFGIPIVLIILFCAWVVLLIYCLGFRATILCKKKSKDSNDGQIRIIIQSQYNQMGTISFKEVAVTLILATLILLWIFRSPKFIAGWNELFTKGYVSDGTAAMFMCFLLFVLPTEWPDFLFCPKRDAEKNPQIREPLVTWKTFQEKMPWGVILLAGGSFALADAIETSGLSKTMGNAMGSLGHLSPFALCCVAAVFATFVTEFTANAATATLLAPIFSAVAEKLGINPLYLVLTSTICVSYAFMLPTANAPNAIVFGYGLLKITDMVIVGFFMNCIAVVVTIVAVNTWIWHMFDLGTYPDWAPLLYNTTTFNRTI